ncbi:MAG: protein-glutamate O-methyltransferase CheR [Planctomycetales bacterium]
MESSQLTPREFEEFQTLIFKLCGIKVPENKIMLLSNRIRRRLKAAHCDGFRQYLQLLKSPSGKEELQGLLNVVTTNETSFFRTEKHFEWLQTEFIEEMLKLQRQGQKEKSIRVWSAACSTGEEPYTISIALAENQLKLTGWTLQVLGTDISEQAMAKARQGIYTEEDSADIPDKLRSRYFRRRPEGDWEIKPALRNLVQIERHNLLEPQRSGLFDCIFIRNVLIYFSRESKQVVIDNLVRALAPGGYLVVGPSEGIFDMLGMLTRISTFLYRKD